MIMNHDLDPERQPWSSGCLAPDELLPFTIALADVVPHILQTNPVIEKPSNSCVRRRQSLVFGLVS